MPVIPNFDMPLPIEINDITILPVTLLFYLITMFTNMVSYAMLLSIFNNRIRMTPMYKYKRLNCLCLFLYTFASYKISAQSSSLLADMNDTMYVLFFTMLNIYTYLTIIENYKVPDIFHLSFSAIIILQVIILIVEQLDFILFVILGLIEIYLISRFYSLD